MLFSGRAYYNLLWLHKQRGLLIPASSWELENYREMSISFLLLRLRKYNIFFNKKMLKNYFFDADSPELFLESLIVNIEDKNKVYLIIFELWRRLNSEKQAISIFCDELDRRIFLYEKDGGKGNLSDYLKNMLEILDRNVDLCNSPEGLFRQIASFLAHDIEQVFFTYIETNISSSEDKSMINLIERLMPYVKNKRYLWFIKLRIISDILSEKKTDKSYFFNNIVDPMNRNKCNKC